MEKYIIAIDGPAGTGKSTISSLIAKRLNFLLVKTGDMFRAIALKMIQENIDINNIEAVNNILKNIDIRFQYFNGNQITILDNKDVSNELFNNEISLVVSDISKIEEIRNRVLEYERDVAKNNNIVIEGRDIGTAVFPNANVKIFLTASAETRANRRYKQNIKKGINIPLEEITKEIIKRDENDTTRKINPLKKADDAVIVESDDKSIEEVENEILEIILNKIGEDIGGRNRMDL